MPIESSLLDGKPTNWLGCPYCLAVPLRPFMRGEVQRSRRSLFSWPPFKRRPYCALICSECKEIIAYEEP